MYEYNDDGKLIRINDFCSETEEDKALSKCMTTTSSSGGSQTTAAVKQSEQPEPQQQANLVHNGSMTTTSTRTHFSSLFIGAMAGFMAEAMLASYKPSNGGTRPNRNAAARYSNV